MPTGILWENGKCYAVINSLTNSTYALIHNEVSFSDTKGKWYDDIANEAGSRMIVSGAGDGTFAPGKNITRQEAMSIIWRASKIIGFTGSEGSIDDFTDAHTVNEWAVDAIRWNVGSGLVFGMDGKLSPDTNLTRAEATALVLRLMQRAGLI